MHVAKAAGHYSSTWLSLIETGKRALSSKDIVPLCKALKLSPEELVGPLQIIHEESTPKRIMRDYSLTEAQKAALVAVYEEFVKGTTP